MLLQHHFFIKTFYKPSKESIETDYYTSNTKSMENHIILPYTLTFGVTRSIFHKISP